MTSFSYMSSEAVFETIEAQRKTGEPYPMYLNHTDFMYLMITLRRVWNDDVVAPDVSAWAGAFASTIAQTLGIEMI
jgi:hypothetical protein